jgi:hypothetical protein
MWDSGIRETKAEVAKRARDVLDYIFQKDADSTCMLSEICDRVVFLRCFIDISVTAHGGIINGFLQAIGRPPFPLSTGGM